MEAILTTASLAVAVVAATATAHQAPLLRFSLKVQSLLDLEKRLDERHSHLNVVAE